jgi:hypothetical protein
MRRASFGLGQINRVTFEIAIVAVGSRQSRPGRHMRVTVLERTRRTRRASGRSWCQRRKTTAESVSGLVGAHLAYGHEIISRLVDSGYSDVNDCRHS